MYVCMYVCMYSIYIYRPWLLCGCCLAMTPLHVDSCGDAGCAYAQLKRNTTLKVLRLSECHVGPKFPAKYGVCCCSLLRTRAREASQEISSCSNIVRERMDWRCVLACACNMCQCASAHAFVRARGERD